ncbi:MAG: radical SAM family heme chaperone HemW [Phenylobacterium sp.]|uniref:radical SAM family heme chaperone HemW n=1 Tax=Phenylobacterium sp. TaxID=1871053 RepID=UPI002733C653|nr:radical SAM family heme chaperone HemW [Phenylobacterium sp.]MDP3173165.1 radical SAM family heme chaperone HemW [Phenylobacterium sp.]
MTNRPPLGVYVHWPYCARICPYCDFNVFRDRGRRAEQLTLVQAIEADLTAQAALSGPRSLVSIFFGGGTPSLMDPEWAGRLIALAVKLWTPTEDLEVSLEANPTDAEADRFAAFADAGVRRLSLGLQSLNDDALGFLGRNHDAAAGMRAARAARRAFPRLSLDLIYARPGQTVSDWRSELQAALDLDPEHLSPYQLTIEDGTPFDRAVRRGRIAPPGEDAATDLFETTQTTLEAAGFDAYEVSNHARGEDARSRHNLVYWRGWDYVGAGPGAHGRLTIDGARQATIAAMKPVDYIACVAQRGVGFATRETLNPVEAAEERLLLGLRIDDGVGFEEVSALGLRPSSPQVRELVDLGLLAADPTRLRATRQGRLLLDRVTAALITGA